MSTTLADLIQMVRWRVDIPGTPTGGGYVTDTEITAYLNSSLAELDDLLIQTYQDYKVTSANSTISSTSDGTNYFSLPTDFYQARGVDRQESGSYVTLQPYNFQKRNTYNYPAVAAPYGYLDVHYLIQGDKCFISPWQDAVGTYRLWYVPKFINLVDSADTLEPYMDTNAWSEFAVVDVAIKILQKQDLDASSFMAQKAALQGRVVNAAGVRDAGPPKRMADTRYARRRGVSGGWGGFS